MTQQVRRVISLGATGSIGVQAADVISRNPDRFDVVGLAATGSRLTELLAQVEALAGHPRVWVVLTHVLPQRRDSVEGMLERLREIGIEKFALLDHRRSFGTSAYLFDLSAAESLHSFGPETLTEGAGAPMCGAGPASNWRSRSPG